MPGYRRMVPAVRGYHAPGPLVAVYAVAGSLAAYRHGRQDSGCWIVGRRALLRHFPGWADDFSWQTVAGPFGTQDEAAAAILEMEVKNAR